MDRNEFKGVMDEYYRLRGWNTETGIPEGETLKRFGLSREAEDIDRLR